MRFLVLLSVLVGVSFVGATAPNVLLVFVDDMGWGDFSSLGNTDVETQHIDRLAAEGIRFDQFYVNSPLAPL